MIVLLHKMYGEQDRFNFPVRTILKTISAATGTSVVDLYCPTLITPFDDVEGTRYAGFITFLTATINIKSLGEVEFPPIPESALPEEVQQILDEVSRLTADKSMGILTRFEGQTPQEVCTLPVFNQSFLYRISLMPFFSGTNNTIDVGCNQARAGEVLSLQMVDRLQRNDRIFIRGSVIERASWKLPKARAKEVTYQSYQRTVTADELIVLAANPKRNNATFINYYDPPATANWQDYVIWIKQGNGQGKPLFPRVSYYQITRDNYWSGPVWARSSVPTQLAVEEGKEV
ncbi:hypothetical protein [Microseira wollei]|uniref:Uncharacterized protein n=1 Tax=Microseira wollei NIES-4236 TaxID=2530354 RepID=A0AAV3XR00_9CYAN|nr:hypothetical protein [Microseira wollei]GET42997.1 hypothetical protein MiSe_78170 [Microseira wollei NIES-4236]